MGLTSTSWETILQKEPTRFHETSRHLYHPRCPDPVNIACVIQTQWNVEKNIDSIREIPCTLCSKLSTSTPKTPQYSRNFSLKLYLLYLTHALFHLRLETLVRHEQICIHALVHPDLPWWQQPLHWGAASHEVLWINLRTNRLVQCFQIWSMISWIKVIPDPNDGLETYSPEFLQWFSQNADSEPSPGIKPNSLSLKRSAVYEKTARYSETDDRWPLTQRPIAHLVHLIKASAVPLHWRMSAGPNFHSLPALAPTCIATPGSIACQTLNSSLASTICKPGSEKVTHGHPLTDTNHEKRKSWFRSQKSHSNVRLYNRGRGIWHPMPFQC